MSRFVKTVYSPQPPLRVFEVVNDIESYPQFVPWCCHAEIIERGDRRIKASLGFRVGLKSMEFSTENTSIPGESIEMRLIEGPFRRLEGLWRFLPEGAGTKVVCEIDYEFASARTAVLFSLFFPKLMGYLVASFVNRTESRAG